MLDRIEKVDPRLNCYRVVLADQALEAAAKVDAPNDDAAHLPLRGVPVAVKDSVDVAGQITTWGTSANVEQAESDAPIVTALRGAGAIIIGKTNLSELAAWPFTETSTWGATRNPWNTGYSPGGSSGGSAAAVAAGLCGMALGSDGLGSIRAPASFTGVFGLKPQRDRVWHDADNWHGLAVNGPLARSVTDGALFLDATATDAPTGHFSDAVTRAARPLRIAVAWRPLVEYPLTAKLGDEQRQAVQDTIAALEELGHTVVEREIDFPRQASSNGIIRYLAGLAQGRAALDHPDRLSPRTARMANSGRRIPRRMLQRAIDAEPSIARRINRVFDDVDVVLTPGAVQPPPRIGEQDGHGASRTLMASGKMIPHFAPWNVIGQPATSLPAGFTTAGLPLSVQFAGRPNDEATLLALCTQVEKTRPWAQHRPPTLS